MPKKNMKKLMLAGMTFMLAFVMTACGGSGERNTDRLVVAQTSDATSLDLHAANDASSSLITVQIFETLVRMDEEGTIGPGLAESWEQIDELTWEFNLKQGVKFHSGEELTASDVEFTLLRALESPQLAAIVSEIDPEGIEIIDDYTIRIATKEPFVPFLRHLSHSVMGIMSEKDVTEMEANEINVGQNPIGTGPFEFVNWVPGDRVELKRFEDYHGDLPAYSELVVRVIQENSSRTIELQTGEIDIALNVNPSDFNRIEEDEDLKLLTKPNFTTTYIGFNTNKAPFDNVKVRQALNYAINSASILENVLLGAGSVSVGPIGANVWGARTDLEVYDFNLDRARELLAEAGYPDGFTTTIWTSNAGTTPDIITAVQAQLREIGVIAEVSQMEWGAYIDALAEGEHDMFIIGWGSVTGDADYGLYSLFHSSIGAEGGNRTFLENERIDYLLDLGRITQDEEERLAIYAELQEIIVEEAPWIFLFTGQQSVGTRADVKGFTVNPTGHHRFAGVYFEETE